jgi:hypothetical protein
MSRHDRFGERTDDDDAPVRPSATLFDDPDAAAAPLPERRCELCSTALAPTTGGPICAECRLVIRNRLGVEIPERWAPAVGLDDVIVSDRGRVARLLTIDRSHRYERVSIGGEKRFVHQLVCGAFHGPRPSGLLALHADDVSEHNDATNLSWGSAKQNSADAKRNRTNKRRENT